MERTITNSNIESIKVRETEKMFYKYLGDSLTGTCLYKISPESGLYFDLLYIQDKEAALFKFMDTNEDTFEIIGDEIIEVIQEERQVVEDFLQAKLGYNINYYFLMPYVDLGKFKVKEPFILDQKQFEDLMNLDLPLSSLLSPIKERSKFLYELGNEYYVYNTEVNHGDESIDLSFKGSPIKGILMEEEQIQRVNTMHYGTSYIEGPTGTGKTSILLSKAIKLARLFPKDQFLYITFDKQSNNHLKSILTNLYTDIENIRVINFHQFVLKLGSKHNLRLNKNSKQNFNAEFKKVFKKVTTLYKGKRFYKGIFVDESENFDQEEIEFLDAITQSSNSFIMYSLDIPKKMSPSEMGEKQIPKSSNHYIQTKSNYRQSETTGYFNRNFQNDINTFSLLELEEVNNYFLPFDIKRKSKGKVNIVEYDESQDITKIVTSLIESYLSAGHSPSDMGIIYPYNLKVAKGNKRIDSKAIFKAALDEAGIAWVFADDNTNSLQASPGITLSNIYNFTNLEKKTLIFCQLDTMYEMSDRFVERDTKKLLNIIYTATGRVTEDLHIMIKKDDSRPGIIDLLSQKR